MIPYQTFPIINLGFVQLKTWGVLVALGFLVAIILTIRKAKTKKEKEHMYSIATIILASSIIGSRMLHVAQFWHEYSANPLEALNIFSGGLAFYGGFVLAIIATYIYVRVNKLNFWVLADKLTAPMALGIAIARTGCWLIGDHLGLEANLPWSIMHAGVLRHPVTLYHILSMLLLFLILILMENKKIVKKTFPGFLFLSFGLYYALHRLIIDSLRIDPRYFLNLTLAQILSIPLFLSSITLIILKIKIKRKK